MTRRRYDLTDHEWSIPSPLLPNKPRSVPRVMIALPVGLAAVDNDALRPAMPGERLYEEAFGGIKVTMLAELELDRASVAVDGPIEICPTTANLDIFVLKPVSSMKTSRAGSRSG